MRVGIIGLGKMGLLHAGIINVLEKHSIVCIAERERMITDYVKSAMAGVSVYQDSGSMLKTERLDLVYITTPVSSHLPIALECIENETSFFMEKPLSVNIKESGSIVEALRHSKVIHAVGYNRRFVDTFSKAQSMLSSGQLGRILSVKASVYVSNIFTQSSGWRAKKNVSGGGVLLDLGSHVVDLLLWYFGQVKSVRGTTESPFSMEVEDSAHMEIEFESGTLGELDASWSMKGYRLPEINLEIAGEKGEMHVNEDFIRVKLNDASAGEKGAADVQGTTLYKQSLNTGVPVDLGGQDYTKEDMHMLDCVKSGSLPLINVFEGSRTQSVIDAMYEAARSKSSVEVGYLWP